MTLMVDELVSTRASLLRRLKDWQDQASWQTFFDTYWKLIYSVARKSGLSDPEAQDVVQETMISVARHMPAFEYDSEVGSFRAWLLSLTRWRIADQLRKRGKLPAIRPVEGETGTSVMDRVADPVSVNLDAFWDEEWRKNLLEAAMVNVRRNVDPKKYQMFDFYVNKHWPPEKVASTLGIPVSQVYMAKHRITEMIKEEVKRVEKGLEIKPPPSFPGRAG